MQEEEWVEMYGHGQYEIHPDGRVRSIDFDTHGDDNTKMNYSKKGKLLKKDGYSYNLYNYGVKRKVSIKKLLKRLNVTLHTDC